MDGFRFISGSFTILNRKAMNLLLNSRRRLDFSLIDDVCFGRLFKSNEISTEDLASINVEEVSSVPSLESIHETFHFRCKSGTVNRNDLAVMQHLMRQIKKNELNS